MILVSLSSTKMLAWLLGGLTAVLKAQYVISVTRGDKISAVIMSDSTMKMHQTRKKTPLEFDVIHL